LYRWASEIRFYWAFLALLIEEWNGLAPVPRRRKRPTGASLTVRAGDPKQNPVFIAFGIELDSGIIASSTAFLTALALDPRWPADKAATPALDRVAGAPEDLKRGRNHLRGTGV
jgi:hypothetical protein